MVFNLVGSQSLPNGGVSILDVPCGLGIKAVRILKEVDNSLIKQVVAVDLDESCKQFVKINALANQINDEQSSKLSRK